MSATIKELWELGEYDNNLNITDATNKVGDKMQRGSEFERQQLPWGGMKVALCCLLLVPAALVAQDDLLDPKSPLPPTHSPKKDYQVPAPERAIFRGFQDPATLRRIGGIEDFTPVASEKQNSQEYQAWHELILHARQFTTAELLEHARTDIVREELIEKTRQQLRLNLIRFHGFVVQARRVQPTTLLQQAGISSVYEAILELLDEPPNDRLSFVFTECPKELGQLAQAPLDTWLSLDRLPAAVAGYFFKVKPDPDLPILIGKGLQIGVFSTTFSPMVERHLRIFQRIENDSWVARGPDRWEEAIAYNRLLLHARHWSPQQLEEHARQDLRFADLFFDGHRELADGRRDFRGPRSYLAELVRLEGRLVQIRAFPATTRLQSAGIETLYEGWLIPHQEPRGNPVCIVCTELPEAIEATGRVNYWVSFAGYYFKLMRYESAERDAQDPTRFVVKRAPLLLGRSVLLRPDPEAAAPVSWNAFSTAIAVLVLSIAAIAGGLSWWYKQEDRRIRSEIEQQQRNPFESPASL